MVGDGQCCKLFVFRGDRRSACGDICQSGQLAYLLSPHADRHGGDISFTVCLCVCVLRNFVRDISGVGWRRAIKFCRLVDVGVHQVIPPFGDLWPRSSPPRSKIVKSITRSIVSPVRQTCPTVADRVRNRPLLARRRPML